MEFNQQILEAVEAFSARKNLFITGKAGTGKSTLLRHLLDTYERNAVVVAPTGVAALNVDGLTIHRFFGLPPHADSDFADSPRYLPRNLDVMAALETLVVDEVSMTNCVLFDLMETALRRYGPTPGEPFGGVQIVLVGDLFQLPPVVKEEEREFYRDNYGSAYFFDAKSFDPTQFEIIELQKIYRQAGDQTLVDVLNEIRDGRWSPQSRNLLATKVNPSFEPSSDERWLTVCATNQIAKSKNKQALERLPGPEIELQADIAGEVPEPPTEKVLRLKVGAQVMMLTNNQAGPWVNGTIATVHGISSSRDQIDVMLNDGAVVPVYPHTWEVTRPVVQGQRMTSEPVGSFTQFPMRLAWAITIHKSQGQTVDRLVVDVTGGTRQDGQLYVALSRVTSLDGLVLLKPVEARHVRIDPVVRRFTRTQSTKSNLASDLQPVFLGINFVGRENDLSWPRPVEIAAVLSDGRQVSTLVNPFRDMENASHDFGITADDVLLAPSLEQALLALWPLLEGRVPVTFNADQSLHFLDREVKRLGLDFGIPLGVDAGSCPTVAFSGRRALDLARDAQSAFGLGSLAQGEPFDIAPELGGYLMARPTHSFDFQVLEASDELPVLAQALWKYLDDDARRCPQGTRSAAVKVAVAEMSGIDIAGGGADASPFVPMDALTPGARVCFTGTAVDSTGQSLDRQDLEEMARSKGLEPVKNVTKTKCDLLVVAEAATQSRKAVNAAQWGKPVVTVQQFLSWVEGREYQVSTGAAQPPAVRISRI